MLYDRYTADETSFIILNYQTMSARQLAKKLGKPISGVKSKIRWLFKNNVLRRKNSVNQSTPTRTSVQTTPKTLDRYTPEEEKYLRKNRGRITNREMAVFLGRTEPGVSSKLNDLKYSNKKISKPVAKIPVVTTPEYDAVETLPQAPETRNVETLAMEAKLREYEEEIQSLRSALNSRNREAVNKFQMKHLFSSILEETAGMLSEERTQFFIQKLGRVFRDEDFTLAIKALGRETIIAEMDDTETMITEEILEA